MSKYFLKAKLVKNEEVLGIIIMNSQSQEMFIPKNRFNDLKCREFLNAKLSSDNKILPLHNQQIQLVDLNQYEMLYHGSDKILSKPRFGFGKKDNDYGRGFYCTKNKNLAKEWSCRNGLTGYVNTYLIDYSKLNVLYLNSRKYKDIMSWLALLLQHRDIDTSGNLLASKAKTFILSKYGNLNFNSYDVIVGYRADDSYFAYVKDFLNGAISYQKLTDAMFLGKLGVQEVIISKKAFGSLMYLESEQVEYKYIKRYKDRDNQARSSYKRLSDTGNITIIEIMKRGY